MKTGYISKRGDTCAFEFNCRIPLGKRTKDEVDALNLQLADALKCVREGKRTDTVAGIRRAIERLEAIADIINGNDIDTKLIRDSWVLFLNSPLRKDCADSTLENYKRAWDGFVDHCVSENALKTHQIAPRTARSYLGRVGQGSIAPTTYNGILVALRYIWRIVAPEREGIFDGIPSRTVIKREKRALTAHEIEKLLQTATGEELTIIMIGAYTGLRFGDCCKLRTDNVDFEAGTLTVTPSKTARRKGTTIILPLHSVLARHLWSLVPISGQFCQLASTEYVHSRHKPHARVMQVFKDCGIRDAKFHSLRYSFVTQAASAGVPLAVIASIVGHSAVKMTEHYTKPNLESKRAAILALPEVKVA